MVIHYLLDKVQSTQATGRVAGATLLVLLAIQQNGLFLGPLLACLLLDLSSGRLGQLRIVADAAPQRTLQRSATALLGAWLLAVMLAALVGRFGGASLTARPFLAMLAPGTYLGAFALGATLVATLTAVAAGTSRRRQIWARSIRRYPVVPIALGALAIGKAWQTGRETAVSLQRANYDAQRWAREHTQPHALFLLADKDLPWRTQSFRSAVRMAPEGQYVYSGSRYAKERFFDRAQAIVRSYPAESPAAVLAFATEYGASYIVRRRDVALPLPMAYSNSDLVIYRAPSGNRVLGVP
jgi:hypothetical protein